MKRTTPNNVRPTEFELELLRLLWTKNGATVRDLYEVLSESRELGYTTILKTLQIMTEKGLVKREEVGKAHVYRAARSEEHTQKQLIRYLSERLFDGSAAQLVMHALSTQALDSEELKQIKELISQKESQA
jgi:BlaI family transcriptional regulator, penicillinase repressor